MVEQNMEPEKDYSDPKYDRFRDMPFSKIYDKDGNDVTRERMLPKVIKECRVCEIPIKIIEEDYKAGVAIIKCKPCQKGGEAVIGDNHHAQTN